MSPPRGAVASARAARSLLGLWPHLLVLALFQLGYSGAALGPERLAALYRTFDDDPVGATLRQPLVALRFQLLRNGDERLYHAWGALALGAPVDLAFLSSRSDATVSRAPRVAPAGRALLPYRDFPFEYPPLALLPMVASAAATVDPVAYPYVFGTLAALAALAAVLCGERVRLRLEPDALPRYGLASALALLLVGFSVEARIDVFATALVAGALLAALHDRPLLVGVLLGAGAATKVYPVLLWPALVAPLVGERRLGEVWRSLGALLAVAGGAAMLGLAASAEGFVAAMRFQGQRGLQVESVGASLFAGVGLLVGAPLGSAHAFGSMDVVGAGPALLAGALRLLVPLGALGAAALALRASRRRPAGPQLVVDALGLAIALLWVTSPVLSAQYLLWGVPVLLLVRPRAARVLYLLALFVTQIEFPTCWGLVSNLQPAGVVLLLVRNGLLVALVVVLARHLLRPRSGLPATVEALP